MLMLDYTAQQIYSPDASTAGDGVERERRTQLLGNTGSDIRRPNHNIPCNILARSDPGRRLDMIDYRKAGNRSKMPKFHGPRDSEIVNI